MKNDVNNCDPERLTTLMDAHMGNHTAWTSDELASLLDYQLHVPVPFDLGGFSEGISRNLKILSETTGLSLKSLSDLFVHAHPPLQLLELTKRYAKACQQDPDNPLPLEVSCVLYYASVCAAQVKCQQSITQLDRASLKSGLEHVLQYTWLDLDLRNLLQQGLESLNKEADAFEETSPALSKPETIVPPLSFDPLQKLLALRTVQGPLHPGMLARLDRFEILRLIGEGSMGMVFLARDPLHSRHVAVKLLKPELTEDPRMVHRFLVEARHMNRLEHPNILPVLEICDKPTGPYFTMPFMERSLVSILDPDHPPEPSTVLRIAIDIAKALEFSHKNGIIHRDVKPANVLLDAQGQAFLSDFGLLRTVFNDSLVDVQHSQRMGTTPYMSPAVAAGESEDTRCDIYSLGALLYELMDGKPPYTGSSDDQIIKAILKGPPKPINRQHAQTFPGLVNIVEWAMHRQLRYRYACMSDVVEDLQRVKAHETLLGPKGQGRSIRGAMTFLVLLLCTIGLVAMIVSHIPTKPDNAVGDRPGFVDVPDPHLKAAIQVTLGTSQELTQMDLENLTVLVAEQKHIQSMEGLEYAKNLTNLSICNNEIQDITPLAQLTEVNDLRIWKNPIRDVTPITKLHKLTGLRLTFNEISDVTPLASMTQLTWLNLGGNHVRDISALSNLTNLTLLWLWDNDIRDIAPVSHLKQLRSLRLVDNEVRDIACLSQLKFLSDLRLQNNQIEDISALAQFRNLEYLNLKNNPLNADAYSIYLPIIRQNNPLTNGFFCDLAH